MSKTCLVNIVTNEGRTMHIMGYTDEQLWAYANSKLELAAKKCEEHSVNSDRHGALFAEIVRACFVNKENA